jgi:mannose-6-phosphate isomerase-like protein (cupin superfamily)
MVMVEKEQHLKMRMEHIRFGKEELERRRKSPVHIPAEHVAAQLKDHYHVYIVDPRLGFNQRTFRFWINFRALGEEMEYSGKQLGHRHTVEAVIYIHQGHGYSVIDGVEYPWEAGDLICVPVFAWHRHHNESQEDLIYFAATTGPFSMATGIALYEEENYPEYWVFAQKGEEAMKTLIPGGAEVPPGGKVDLDQSRWKPEGPRSKGEPTSAEIYFDQLNFESPTGWMRSSAFTSRFSAHCLPRSRRASVRAPIATSMKKPITSFRAQAIASSKTRNTSGKRATPW